jgi:Na+/H+ antiporter NhaD/arsenite permease-like protein
MERLARGLFRGVCARGAGAARDTRHVAGALVVGTGAAGSGRLAAIIPRAGLVVILLATALEGPVRSLAAAVPSATQLLQGPASLVAVAAVGGLLAATVNNLPAAAFGAAWLAGAGPAVIVAFLVGTNIVALATPHGSPATMLARSVARASGHEVAFRRYVLGAWRYAAAGGIAALLAVALFR